MTKVLRCALVLSLISNFALAEKPKNRRQTEKSDKFSQQVVDLFEGQKNKSIEVQVIPKDTTAVTLQVTNKTNKPLQIRLPKTFAAVPVLAQFFQPQGQRQGGQQGGQGGQQGGFQGLGGAFNGNNGGGGGNQGGNQGNGFNFGANQRQRPFGMFNVLPGKTVRKKFPCVCLDYGKKDPQPRIAYRLVPLSDYNQNPDVRRLLEAFHDGQASQAITQLAAWHLSSGKSWQELSEVKYTRANGRQFPRFSSQALSAARKLVAALPADPTKTKTSSLADKR